MPLSRSSLLHALYLRQCFSLCTDLQTADFVILPVVNHEHLGKFFVSNVKSRSVSTRPCSRTVNDLLPLPHRPTTSKFSSDDFAAHFCGRVVNIKAYRHQMHAPLPDIQHRPATNCLSAFNLLTITEILSLFSSSPTTKSCCNSYTWLHERLPVQIALAICILCHFSQQAGFFPSFLERAVVTPRLKKSTHNPNDNLKSYCPISNLSFFSEVAEPFGLDHIAVYPVRAVCLSTFPFN